MMNKEEYKKLVDRYTMIYHDNLHTLRQFFTNSNGLYKASLPLITVEFNFEN